jgi:type I restriction enzyme S subunit
MPISALGRIETGTTPPTKETANYEGGVIPFISPGDFQHGGRIADTEKRITEKGLSIARPLSTGATCFVCIGSTIGKVGLVTSPVCATNQQINAIVPNERFRPTFVFHLMTAWSEHVRHQASPSPVPILSKGRFEGIEIVATEDSEEQAEIAAILDAIDEKIDLHLRKQELLQELFKSRSKG